MPSISLLFHATRPELLAFVAECMEELGVHVTAIRERPFQALPMDPEALEQGAGGQGFKTLVLTVTPPRLNGKDINEFNDRNPHGMSLEVGSRSKLGLKESWLASATGNAKAAAVWKKVAGKLKKITHTGGAIFDPEGQDTSPLPDHRYTSGAMALQEQGVRMLTISGCPMLLGKEGEHPQKRISPKRSSRTSI